MTIVIAGGSGYIGTQLSKKLLSLGHRVVVIDVRGPVFTHSELFFIQCDISTQPLPYDVLEKTDAVINLAGKTIATKWTAQAMEEIKTSRIESTKHIVETIKNTKNKPSCFISASAIGFYGDTAEEECDEKCVRGEGFLADVVSLWEEAAREATLYGVRTVCVRTAPVLGHGGFLSQITKTARLGFLVRLAKKDFWMSWIHEEDIIATYIFALETTTVQGVFNASAPETVRHSVFMKTLGSVMKKTVIGAIPSFIAKKMFGSFFEEITKSQRITPKRLTDKGFVFMYPTLQEALQSLYKNKK